MPYRERVPSLTILSKRYQKVPGLRNAAPPSDCMVYKAVLGLDGKLIPGKLIRIEKAK